MSGGTATVKGTAILARENYIQQRWGTAGLTEARRRLASTEGAASIIASTWYPRTIYDALGSFAREYRKGDTRSLRREMGAAEAKFLLSGPYTYMVQKDPKELLLRLPAFFSCIYMDVKADCAESGPTRISVQMYGSGFLSRDQDFYQGLLEGVLLASGADKSKIMADPSRALGAMTYQLMWDDRDVRRAGEAVNISGEYGILECRSKAREVCKAMGFGTVDTVGIITCVSELARNIVNYAGEGRIQIEETTREGLRCLEVRAIDHGPGISNLEDIMKGNHRSEKGMGMGLLAIKRLADEFKVSTHPGQGTVVEIAKYVKRH